ncbi:hypothetical protein VHEMI09127 [[Torrubiella] hemipterigena]|uniref:Uncharacterized protein n=1 Tax=[Torrubiella] hemipterigena TaxID=1531966 RepID=A0A0A1TQX9_9HYPO|nr:hypothetical protein VHEMI09127 [[Torrubiella] hemipterigena]
MIKYLTEKYNFTPSEDQLWSQTQKWSLQRNFKRSLQVMAMAKAEEQGTRPTGVLIGDRWISTKRLKKTATAMAREQKRKTNQNAAAGPSETNSGKMERLKRMTRGQDNPGEVGHLSDP